MFRTYIVMLAACLWKSLQTTLALSLRSGDGDYVLKSVKIIKDTLLAEKDKLEEEDATSWHM